MQHEITISYSGGFEQLADDLCALNYNDLYPFFGALSKKMERDGYADKGRSRYKLSVNLFASSVCFEYAKEQTADAGKEKLQYPQESMTFVKYEGGYLKLAEDLGDLRYDALAEFLKILAEKLRKKADQEKADNEYSVAAFISQAANMVLLAKRHVYIAWRISKPKMKPDGSC